MDDQATEAIQLVIVIIADGQRTKDHAELDAAVSGFLGLGEFAQSKAMPEVFNRFRPEPCSV